MSLMRIGAASWRRSAGPPVSGYFDEVMADSPIIYARHAEASGGICENEVGADGGYVLPLLGEPALYSGGLTSVRFNSASAGAEFDSSLLPASSAPELTLETIMNPGAISGIRQIISRDDDSGTRVWQWVLNDNDINFVKIVGGVEVVGAAHGMSAGTEYHIAVSVTTAGLCTIYVNGSSVVSTSMAPANYGSDTREISINTRAGSVESTDNTYAESAVYDVALSGARIAAHAAAAGF